MPKITVLPHHEICPEGAEVELEAGSNLCKALLEKGIKIEHACEMSKPAPHAMWSSVKVLIV